MERPWLMLARVLLVDLAAYAEYAAAMAAQAAAQAQHPAVVEADEDGVIDAHVYDAQRAAAAEAAAVLELELEAQDDDEQQAAVGDADADADAEDGYEDEEEEEDPQAQAALEESVVATNPNAALSAWAHAARGAAEPDFTIEVAAPARVTPVIAGRSSQPDPDRPDMCPYIVATGRFCLLAHFSVAPFYGTNFGEEPEHSHLVVVRHFRRADEDGGHHVVAACAERVPDRPHNVDGEILPLRSIDSVGLICNQATGHYKIAELFVTTDAPEAEVVFMRSDTREWYATFHANPLARESTRRDWVPHGTVTVHSTVCWFDLSWGIISCDFAQPVDEQSFIFHPLPPGRFLTRGSVPDLHGRRCVAVSQNFVRFVEIDHNPPQPAMAKVNMWHRDLDDQERRWNINYSVKFEDIWADESYHQTGLPRRLPVLVGVSPVNSSVVYFSLENRLFGVDVPQHRVVHCQRHDPLITRPGPPDELVTSRYLITWNLDADQGPNAGHVDDQLSDHADSSGSGPADEGVIDYMEVDSQSSAQ